MAIVERVSSMVEGLPCCVIIDHRIKYFPVHEKENKKYINIGGKRMNEDDLPFGIEVKIGGN